MVFSDLFFLFVFLPLFVALYLIAAWIERPRNAAEECTSDETDDSDADQTSDEIVTNETDTPTEDDTHDSINHTDPETPAETTDPVVTDQEPETVDKPTETTDPVATDQEPEDADKPKEVDSPESTQDSPKSPDSPDLIEKVYKPLESEESTDPSEVKDESPADDIKVEDPFEEPAEEISEAAAETPITAPVQPKRHNTLKNIVLIVFSLLFYAWGEPVYVFLMLACVLYNYIFGLGIGTFKRGRKFLLFLGVLGNIAILGSFKYLTFFAETLAHFDIEIPDPRLSLPIGISFYIFQSITYLVDVYRKDSPVQRSFWGLLLYISMFPQLIAGPIVRYRTVADEIHGRHVTADDIAAGVVRFIIGLAKKVIIANQLGEVATQLLANGLHSVSVAGAWIGVAAFTLQIYFDFSGYSDMAIGIGRCLGFHFNENFDHPYCSRTITEFWRRWHMSLGQFFRDYVYIPLGGNRRHQFFNIMVVWFLTGMWHGASWNFIIWGLYFGIILIVEKHTVMNIRDRVPAPLLHLYTMFIVTLGFGIFYFDDFDRLGEFLRVAFFAEGRPLTDFVSTNVLFEKFWLWLAALVLCMPVRRYAVKLTAKVTGGYHHWCFQTVHLSARLVICAVLLFISIALLIGATNNAFLYTRF